MKKRMLAMLMALCLIVGLLPMSVLAGTAEDHTQYEPLSAHDDAKHICEHCVASGAADTTPTWTAWGEGKTTLPTAEGHYYLTADLNVTTADLTAGHVVLCLNGHTVTASGTQDNANDRFYSLKNASSVTILDCTAHWETVDGKQVYKAGTFTGGSASGFMHNSATSTTGALNIYDGIFTGNSRASSGGVICVQGKGTLNIYGGLFENNRCTNSSGGVIYLGSSSNTTHIEGAIFKGNTAKTSGGVMYNYGKPSVTIKDTVMTENSAPSAGVIVSLGAITYENVTITGNTTTSGAYGALHHYNGTTATVILKGKTVIDDNYYGDHEDGVERNVWLREHWYYVKNDGLTEGAKVGISMDPKRLALTDTRINIISGTVEESVKDFFSSDDPAYIVDVVEGRLKLVDKPEGPVEPPVSAHPHTCEHCASNSVEWIAWGEGGETTLPTAAGHYYLTQDLTVTSVDLTSGHVVLCLNGKTVTAGGTEGNAADRFYQLKTTGSLSIVDCTATGEGDSYKAGTMTGGSASAFMFNSATTTEGALNIYDGIFTDNRRSGAGGVCCVQGKGKLNVYGGQFLNNSSTTNGGVFYLNSANNPAHIENALFKGNTATNSAGALYNNKATVTLKNVTMTENSAPSAGVIVSLGKITYQDTTITGNTTLSGAYGALHHYNSSSTATVELIGKTVIDGNFFGDPAQGAERNLWLRNHSYKVSANGLTKGAMIGLSWDSGKVTATNGNQYITTKLDGFDPLPYFSLDQEGYELKVVDGGASYGDRMIIAEEEIIPTHIHKLCSDTACTDHEDVGFRDWTKTTSLPVSGSYCLTEDVTLTAAVELSGSLTLCLNGHSITMTKAGRVFAMTSGDVLTITDCKDTGVITGGNNKFGGMVNVGRGSTLNLYGGILTGHTSTSETEGQGGAIYLQAMGTDSATGGILNMYGGTICGNEATWGGAVYARKGAQLNIYGGTIENNKSASYGGAIYACEGITTNILGGSFTGNHAKTGGGAVYVTGANSVLNVQNAAFANNTIDGYAGGALFIQSGNSQMNVTGCTITGSKAQAGGAIFASSNTKLTVTDTYFSGNTASQGGCVYTLKAETLIKNSVMEKNTCSSKAAAIYNSGSKMTLEGNTIKNNKGGSGTAITTGSATVTENGASVIYYPEINLLSGAITGNQGTSGVILLQSKTVFNMAGGEISGNSTSYAGGVYASTNATFNMSGGKIANNTTKNSGGAIYALRATVKMTGGTISGNKATKMGGGIFLSGANFTMTGGTITGNKTDTGTGGGGIGTGTATASGAKYAPSVQIYGGTISHNYGRHGGAILLQGTDKTLMTISGGSFHNNEGKVDGAAFYISTNTKLVMTGGSFQNNVCKGRAGAIFFNNSKGEMSNVTFKNNSAGSSGGAICINGRKADITIKDSSFDTHAGASGGTICHQGYAILLLENVQITNSFGVNNGGGVYLANNIHATFNNVTITNAISAKVGGGMYWGNNAVVRGNGLTIENCVAQTGDGGGVYSRSASTILENVKLIGNKSARWGGGITLYRPAMQGVSGSGDYKTGVILTNVEIRNNETEEMGGGIWSDSGSKLCLENAVVTGNTSGQEGGGIWSQGDLTLRNVDVNGNGSGGEGYAVFLADAKFDGHSYQTGSNKMSGNVKVENNQNGDLFMGPTTTIMVEEAGLGQDTRILVTLDKGVLTNRVFGKYDYEGGNLEYTITYGEKSFTAPEYDETLVVKTQEETQAKTGDVLLYAGIGVIALAAIAAAVLLILKKKKPAKAEN